MAVVTTLVASLPVLSVVVTSSGTVLLISNGNRFDVEATVLRLEYDPNRTAFIALVEYADGEKAYILGSTTYG
jgi:ribosomal protein L2